MAFTAPPNHGPDKVGTKADADAAMRVDSNKIVVEIELDGVLDDARAQRFTEMVSFIVGVVSVKTWVGVNVTDLLELPDAVSVA